MVERAEQGRLRDPPPEIVQRLPRALPAADGHAVCHRCRVCGARARGTDAVKDNAVLFNQTVEHPPSESTVRAATLQREIDRLGCAGRCSLIRLNTLLHGTFSMSNSPVTADAASFSQVHCQSFLLQAIRATRVGKIV